MHQFYTPDITSDTNTYTLNEEESKHCIRVLRLKIGDTIQLMDGKGTIYFAEILDEHPKKCVAALKGTTEQRAKKYSIHIAIAPTKNMDRLEWFVEKTTEIGIDTIIPINCTNSERTILKTERLKKVAIAAIKQSLNHFLPEIDELTDFKKLIEQYKDFKGQKFIAHCFTSNHLHLKKHYKKNENALILIGPEGDFTKDEVNQAIASDFIPIKLGEKRLRTETAALYACIVINVLNED